MSIEFKNSHKTKKKKKKPYEASEVQYNKNKIVNL